MIELLMQLVKKPVGNTILNNNQQQQRGTDAAANFRVGFNDQTLAF
jgi:hypothetical protein